MNYLTFYCWLSRARPLDFGRLNLAGVLALALLAFACTDGRPSLSTLREAVIAEGGSVIILYDLETDQEDEDDEARFVYHRSPTKKELLVPSVISRNSTLLP